MVEKQESERVTLDMPKSLHQELTAFIEWFDGENHTSLSISEAVRMTMRAGIGTMKAERAQRKLQDKQNRGALKK